METKKTAGKAAGAIGMLLTGMGADGAQGLLAMKRADCLTLVQDEVSSVVWGMPGSVVKIDAQPEIVSIHKIACFPRNNSRTLFLNYNLFQ